MTANLGGGDYVAEVTAENVTDEQVREAEEFFANMPTVGPVELWRAAWAAGRADALQGETSSGCFNCAALDGQPHEAGCDIADLESRARRAEALNAAYDRDLARVTAERDEAASLAAELGTICDTLGALVEIGQRAIFELAEVRQVVREFVAWNADEFLGLERADYPEWDALCRVAADDQTTDAPNRGLVAPQTGAEGASGPTDPARAQPGNLEASCQCDASGCPVHDDGA